MNYDDFGKTINNKSFDLEVSQTLPRLMRKVYTWMTMALVITGMTAWGVATTPALQQLVLGSRLVFFALIAGELGLVFWLSARIGKLSLPTATLLFVAYSVLNGATMASIFLVYTMSSIAKVFFITAGMFGAMAFVGYTTKRDLTRLGGILLMALIGVIIASLVNLFIGSSGFDLVLSYAVVLIFVGLTAWDSQKIKEMLSQFSDTGETAQKVALMGALSLYLDFINLFIHLLRILGSSRD